MALHATVISVAYFGVPRLLREPPPPETPIMVEIATIAEVSNPPPPAPEPPKEWKARTEAPKPPPPPEPPKAKAEPPPAPPPPPEPEPAPKVAALPPPPEAKPKAEKKAEPKPEPEAKPKPAPSPVLAKVKPPKKPPPPDAFASVLKTLEDLKRQPPKPKEPPEEKAKPKEEKSETFEQQMAKALTQPRRAHDPNRPLAISEIDLVRQQILKCWNVPAGAKEAWNLIIEVSVDMNQDGTVRNAKVQDAGRMIRDPFFRAAAESALRAVLNPRCQPFKLPPEKYEQWRAMVLNFDPRDML
jgi:hypothetical protein